MPKIFTNTKPGDFENKSWGGEVWSASVRPETFHDINNDKTLDLSVRLPGEIPTAYKRVLKAVLEAEFRREFRDQIEKATALVTKLKNGMIDDGDVAETRGVLQNILNQVWALAETSLKGALDNICVKIDLNKKVKDAFEEMIEEAPDAVIQALHFALQLSSDLRNLDFEKGCLKKIKDALAIVANTDFDSCALIEKLGHENDLAVVEGAQRAAKGLQTAFHYLEEHLPRDLSIEADVVGEGAGTEIAGSPRRWFFVFAETVLAYAIQACDAYSQKYNSCMNADIRNKVTPE